MVLESPGLLWGLTSLPLLWLLHRWWRLPTTVAVPSLAPWLALRAALPPGGGARRRADLPLAVRTLAMTAVVLAAAGPRLDWGSGPSRAPRVVVVDSTASMGALRPDGRTRLEAARALAAREATGPGDHTVETSTPASVLAGTVAARRSRGGEVLFVTDDPEAAPRGEMWAVAGVGSPADNVAITVLEARRGEAVAVVQSYGARDTRLRVSLAGWERDLDLPSGSRAVVRAPLDPQARRLEARFLDWRDALEADDLAVLQRRSPERPRARLRGRASPVVLRALRAAGARVEGPQAGPVHLEVHVGEWPGAWPAADAVVLAAPGGMEPVVFAGGVAPSWVYPAPGATILAGLGLRGLRPGLVTHYATGARVEPLFLGDAGLALGVTFTDGPHHYVALGLDPEDPASNWARHPSFPAFWRRVVARSAGAEWARVEGLLDADESGTGGCDRAPTATGPGGPPAVVGVGLSTALALVALVAAGSLQWALRASM